MDCADYPRHMAVLILRLKTRNAEREFPRAAGESAALRDDAVDSILSGQYFRQRCDSDAPPA